MKYSHIDLDYIYELADGDKEFVTEIINNFLDNTAPQIDNLSQAIAQRKEQDIIFWAHKLKGTFRFIGCTEIGAMLEQIENKEVSTTNSATIINKIIEDYAEVEKELRHAVNNLSTGN